MRWFNKLINKFHYRSDRSMIVRAEKRHVGASGWIEGYRAVFYKNNVHTHSLFMAEYDQTQINTLRKRWETGEMEWFRR